MDIGISTLVDLEVPIAELAAMISAAGFTHLSLSHRVGHAGYHLPAGRKQLGQVLKQNNLKLNYIHAPIEAYHDLSSTDPRVRLATIETYKMCMEACGDLGGRSIVAHATGRMVLDPTEFDEAVELSLDSTAQLCEFGKQLNVRFCLENIPANLSGQKVTTRVMAAADFDNFGLCVDSCHATIGSDDPIATVAWMAPRVHATHLSDTMGDEDSHLLPGEGAVDFNAVARELGRAGFDGVVDLESSLSMLRDRREDRCKHAGDNVPCSTEHYLEKAAAAARRIAENIIAARS